MHIILGGTGSVGSSVAKNLLASGQKVTVVTREASRAQHLKSLGADVAVLNVHETEKLRKLLRTGSRLFLLNPPAAPSSDIVKEELQSLRSILSAIEGSGLEKIVAASTYGAQPGKSIGDLGVLYEMEVALQKLAIPHVIQRGAYYMTNWDHALESARTEGVITSLYPEDFKIPMVDPKDLGDCAAQFMKEPPHKTGIVYTEGPEAYSARQVAEAFSEALNQAVMVVSTPRSQWPSSLQQIGFSYAAALSMAAMTEITWQEKYEKPENPHRGKTTLKEHIKNLVLNSRQPETKPRDLTE